MTNKLAGYQVHPAAKLFPLMVGAEFDALCEDIRHNGQLEAAILWRLGGQDWLLDGRNRVRACEACDIEPVFDHYEGEDPFGYVVSHNLHRRHLQESQRAMVGARLKEVIEAESKAAPKKPPQDAEGEASLPHGSKRRPQARDRAAAMVNVGGRSVQKAAKVMEHGSDRLKGAVDSGIVRVDVAAKLADRPKDEQEAIVNKIADSPSRNAQAVLREHDRDVTIASIQKEGPMPEGPFRVLMVDFPWAYGKRAGDGTQRGQTLYPTMSKGEIELFAAEKLAPLAHDDAMLFLCITNAHLVAGDHVEVLKASGFTGKTMISWDKERMGTGDWLRGQTEHVIVATKGRPTVKLGAQTTVLPMITEGRRAHSQKPEALYELIEELCPGNRVELFSRMERPNWTTWGAETGTLESELGG